MAAREGAKTTIAGDLLAMFRWPMAVEVSRSEGLTIGKTSISAWPPARDGGGGGHHLDITVAATYNQDRLLEDVSGLRCIAGNAAVPDLVVALQRSGVRQKKLSLSIFVTFSCSLHLRTCSLGAATVACSLTTTGEVSIDH